MSDLLKILGFTIVLIALFSSVTYMLPQVTGEAPEEISVEVGNMTMDAFIALGNDLYVNKGACSLCHNDLGRAPNLLALEITALVNERLADARYQGSATNTEEYLRESMVEPSAYVVAGFGKVGTDDTESPMPAVAQPPIQLSDAEIDAIIAFLQDKDGGTVTVALPSASAPPVESPSPDAAIATNSAPAPAVAPAQSAEEALAKYACVACHTILDSVSPIGPELATVGQRLSAEQIRASIVTPAAEIAEGYPPAMPPFPNMTFQELEMLVSFLVQQTGE